MIASFHSAVTCLLLIGGDKGSMTFLYGGNKYGSRDGLVGVTMAGNGRGSTRERRAT